MPDDARIPPHGQLSSVAQVGTTVRDLGQAVEFYRDRLGLTFLFNAPGMAFFQCGDLRLMLSEPEPAAPDRYASILYFRVADIDAAHRDLEQRGVSFLRPPHCVHRAPGVEVWMAFFHDPDRNVLALMQERRVPA
jgi:predicted enzyme related to lactoylglutathione lyase